MSKNRREKIGKAEHGGNMKVITVPTNSSSSNTSLLGWPIDAPPEVMLDMVWFLESRAQRVPESFGRFSVGNLEVAHTHSQMVIGYPVRGDIDINEELVTKLFRDVLLFLEDALDKKYTLDNLRYAPQGEFGILLEPDGWSISAPGFVSFEAGDEGSGIGNTLTGFVSIRWGTPPPPNFEEIRRQIRNG